MNYNKIIKNGSHYGDVLAIPFFALLIIYFNSIPRKTFIEYIFLLFAISGFVLDSIYTYIFLTNTNPLLKTA